MKFEFIRRFAVLAAWSLLLVAGGAQGQAPPPVTADHLAGLEWRALGPAGVGGRVTDVEALPDRPATIYLGSASGGVFKSLNHGTTWRAVFDQAENLSVGDIAVASSDPDVVWVGTGEANNRNSSPYGRGVYKSTDAGETWRRMGLEETRHIGRVLIHPSDPNIVYVAAVGHLFGSNPERGVYRTEDGGKSWERVLFIDDDTGFIDMAMDPAHPRTLYAAAYQRRRRAFGFVGGGPGSGLYKSTDGGTTWRELTDGLPDGNKGRIGIATSESRPNVVMATVEAEGGGVFRSTDRGETWAKVNDLNPRPMYYSKIHVDPNDDAVVYVLGTWMHRSEDEGRTFTQLRFEEDGTYGIGVHPDNHALWIDPADSDHLLLGNDGGFYFSFDRGDNWDIVNNLPIGQFYDIAVDMQDPYFVYGGLQDNQSHYGPSATRGVKGILNRDWTVSDFGDGMYQLADPTDPRFIYTSSQGGAIIRHDPVTGDRKVIKPYPPDTSVTYRFDWTAPMLISPHDPATIYLGGNRLFTTTDRGMSWTASDDLTRNLDRDELPIMGLLTDSTTLSRNDGVAGFSEITAIAESSLRPGLLWVGSDDGSVRVSLDGGQTWREVADRIRDLPDLMVASRVETSHAIEGRAYVAFDGHWNDDYEPYLYVTDDFGERWRRLGYGGDRGLTGSVRVVREHPTNANVLLAGTDHGVFVSLDGGEGWTSLNNNMPRVPVYDLEIHPRDHDVIAGTHGRGIWILDDIAILTSLAAATTDPGLALAPIGPATVFQYRYAAPRLGHGAFRAPNPPYGVLVTYYLSGEQPDGLSLRVRDEEGQVIRTLRAPGRVGVNRVTWDLRLEPLPMDTTVFSPPALDVGPRGPLVRPGSFTVEMSGVGVTATAPVTVRPDPLMRISEHQQQRRYDFTVALYRLQAEEYHAAVQANRLERRADSVVQHLAELAGVPDETTAGVDSLASEVRAVARELRRHNASLRGWWRGLIGEFDGGPSTQGTMTGPTQDQERRFEHARAAFQESVSELDRVASEVIPALNAMIAGLGLKPVEVPSRDRTVRID